MAQRTRSLKRMAMDGLGVSLAFLDLWIEYFLAFLRIFFLVTFFCLALGYFEGLPQIIEWFGNPQALAQHAGAQRFLVMVLTLSGAILGIKLVLRRRLFYPGGVPQGKKAL
ncbi:hypothetical protein [Geoalkalibacter sp.]|uniref:hypothetical protein n=1 Tax=Geoalkalibacter sp. TaxID=3041440 RepID=UPI00272DFEFC|nr:hypothetical protein [Geoalkalibacter sp.]